MNITQLPFATPAKVVCIEGGQKGEGVSQVFQKVRARLRQPATGASPRHGSEKIIERPADLIASSGRHALAARLFEQTVTRILRSPRDRLIAATLAIMVPCSARTAVILGLVAFYLGPNVALAIYGVNILVVALAGKVMSKIWPEITPGLIMEIPPYRLPTLRALSAKTWWRLKEFVLVAWPVLIIGSAALSLAEHWQFDQTINQILQPVTALLALPETVGTTLIFGVMRKELSMLMLMQAVGTTNVAAVMTPVQILTFTMFVVFYIPCLATIAVLWREIGKAQTILLAALTLLLALAIGVLTGVVFNMSF